MSGRGCALAALLSWGVLGPAASLASPPEPPLSVGLRLVSADPARGRYRVEVRLRSEVALEGAALTVRVQPRGAPAVAAGAARPARETREAVSLRPGRELGREVEVLTAAQEPVTLLVGLGGRIDGARLHRTRALDLGPAPEAEEPGRVRTDQSGRGYYEVPMTARPR